MDNSTKRAQAEYSVTLATNCIRRRIRDREDFAEQFRQSAKKYSEMAHDAQLEADLLKQFLKDATGEVVYG